MNLETRMSALKMLRNGLSQAQVAAQIGITQATVSRWYVQYQFHGKEGIQKMKRRNKITTFNKIQE